MCVVASFKNFENSLTTVKVMTKTKVAASYLGHGVIRCCNVFLSSVTVSDTAINSRKL